MQATERPDKVAAGILEGRVAGSSRRGLPLCCWRRWYGFSFFPIAGRLLRTVPTEYFYSVWYAWWLMPFRSFSLVFTLAMTSFHPEMLPTGLALALAAARTGVPFSLLTETLIMETSVEIVREASVRLPGPIGPTVGIVAGLF